MKTFACIMMGFGVAVLGVVLVVGGIFTQPRLTEPLAPTINMYGDTCVVVVIHPELCVELYSVESPGDDCSFCRYYFRVWNRTSNQGTKAANVTAMVVADGTQMATIDGQAIELLRLQGFVQDLRPVQLGTVQDQKFFALDGLCAKCMFAEQRVIKLIVEYYECDGVRRAEVVCDLGSKSVRVVRETFEPCTGCGGC